MKIKLKHEYGELHLTTEHNDPDKTVALLIEIKPFFEGLEALIQSDFDRDTESMHGHYGHTVDLNSTSNLDIRAAMGKLKSFAVVEMMPGTMLANPIPEGYDT